MQLVAISNGLRRTALILLGALIGSAPALADDVLNIYSHRHYGIDQTVNDRFTEETGIEVKVVNADADQLIERLKAEGENSPADLLVTVDAGRLQLAREQGLLQPLKSDVLESATPAALRDPDGYWWPYTARARVIFVSDERVAQDDITTYEDLADERWRGKLAISSSSSPYNQAWVASMVAANGADATTAWAEQVVANMARPPQGGDRDQIRAVANGLADVSVGNAYYFGIMLNSTDENDRDLAGKVRIVFPNQDGRGAFFNVSAVGVTKHARNVDAARAYLEFLVGDEAQQMIAEGSWEYPISLDFKATPTHESWGDFEVDTETFPEIGDHLDDAISIFDQVGWQ
jgi:iron(III) transport system substrate-binding protein